MNLWNPGPDKQRRNQELAAVLRDWNLDVVLLQEMDDSVAQFETLRLGGGFAYGLHAGDVGILSRFKLEDIDVTPLPRRPSLTPLNQLLKFRQVYFICAMFQHNGTRHHVSSHHWDHRKLINRQTAAAAIAGRLSRVPSTSVILCGGDFNTHIDTAEVQRIVAEGLLHGAPPEGLIDFILYRGPGTRVVSHAIEGLPGLTDHPFIVSELAIPDSRSLVA